MSAIETKALVAKTGESFIIRTGQPDDAAKVLNYIRSVAAETRYFVIEADEFPATVDQERSWIQDHLDHPSQLLLLAESRGQVIGSITFEPGPFRRVAHRGNLGIAVAESWRGKGIGTALLESLLAWAEANPLVEKVCLDVFADNQTAAGLYRKLGFIEEGRRIKDVQRGDGDYVDTVMMYQQVRQPE